MREKIVHPAIETKIFIAMKRKYFLPELDCIDIFSNKKLIYVYVVNRRLVYRKGWVRFKPRF
jgi:hypothetical protein